jgi:hypothetical protein
MNAIEIIKYLREHDFTIEADDEYLELSPPEKITEELLQRLSSLSLVRYRSNDYLVPTQYGHREVLVKGYVDHVDICSGVDIIARHVRSYLFLLT